MAHDAVYLFLGDIGLVVHHAVNGGDGGEHGCPLFGYGRRGPHAAPAGHIDARAYGGAAGPAAWLLRAVLGVTPARNGFASVHFAPALGDLEWAQGTIPTPHGPIQVSLRQCPDARPTAEITLPLNVELQVNPDIQRTWEIIELRTLRDGSTER